MDTLSFVAVQLTVGMGDSCGYVFWKSVTEAEMSFDETAHRTAVN